ncbi:hypothetical protein AB0B38_22595 [Streptomyces eurythermus]
MASPFVALAEAISVTERIGLGSCVSHAGFRRPLLLASDVAALAVLSETGGPVWRWEPATPRPSGTCSGRAARTWPGAYSASRRWRRRAVRCWRGTR